MLQIALCDDDRKDLDRISEIVSKTLFDVEDIQIKAYDSGKALIDALEENPGSVDLLLLDIGMEPVDGMEAAAYIRDHKLDMDIIFITKSTEHVYRGYQFRAYAYILKERIEQDIPTELLRYLEELSLSEAYLNITISGELHRIPVSSIRYIESDGRKLILHRNEDEISFYSKMTDIEEDMMKQGFLRIHQSYMVAKKEVCSVRKDTVVLKDTELPVSRRYADQTKKAFE
ncbi:MAG: response regulator transcription factor [Eubacterium sp.]|nr:response regulator transcription factor [Eubacterium sp.]